MKRMIIEIEYDDTISNFEIVEYVTAALAPRSDPFFKGAKVVSAYRKRAK